MNVFENLIDELKEENLIEEPVFESNSENFEIEVNKLETVRNLVSSEVRAPKHDTGAPAQSYEPPAIHESADVILPVNENDFYRRRAMEEVSALQMVERVFSGVEREYLKTVPQPYDDIPVSKALHDFLQISKISGNPENAAAEFKLMQETESWYSALSNRDQKILPAQLRRYCETTRPLLSAQALASLARFYRNSPFTEAVRNKFDLVVTRLFSKEIGNEKRALAFDLNEIAQHVSDLYADWSSVSVYSTDDDSQLTIISLKFEDFITEVADAENFEHLIKNDFFNRLRAFKVSTGENFYAPQVTATAIKCNVAVGNQFIELLSRERENKNAAQIEDKYKFLLDQSVSEAASKTFQLVELLQEMSGDENAPVEVREVKKKKDEFLAAEPQNAQPKKRKTFQIFKNGYGINKWLLGLMFLTILVCFGLYSWVEFAMPQTSTKDVTALEMDGYYFKEYIKVGKVFNNSLIAITAPSWYEISDEKKQEVLKNLLIFGKDKGYKNVHLLDNDGKTVTYISADSITESNSK